MSSRWEFLGFFYSGMNEVFVLLGNDPASQSDWFPVFQDSIVVSSTRVSF
jgi:hypothetical protein